jgi:hypothetical protein
MIKTNADCLGFLLKAKAKIMDSYPFPADTDIDSRFAFALGIILGTAHEAMESVANRRPMRVSTYYVVMSNDYPSAIFSTEAAADSYCAAKNEEDERQFHPRRVFWRTYGFVVDKECKA